MTAPCLNASDRKVFGNLTASPLLTSRAMTPPAADREAWNKTAKEHSVSRVQRLPPAESNPDARLLAAFNEYCAALRELRAAPLTNTDQEDEVFYARMDAASDIMLREPAHTPAGLAAKLWVGLSHTCSNPAIGAAMLGERELTADDEAALDYYQRLIWSALRDARRQAAH